MNKQKTCSFAIISAGIAAMMLAGFLTFIVAEEKKEIPDHTGFQSCQPCHPEKHSMWEDSGHGKAISQTARIDPAAADCKGCHSPQKPDAKQQASPRMESFHKISCLACHGRQKSEFARRVVTDPEKLCDLCHTQRQIFWGKGAKGIDDLRNYHSGVTCVSCHMSEGNHRMKVLRPDDPGLTEKRLDTCTACHQDNNREARVRQLHEYQSTYEEEITPLLADVKTIEAALKKTPNLLNASLKSKFDNVKFNLALMEGDGSRGFHNFYLSLEVASMAAKDLKEIKTAIK